MREVYRPMEGAFRGCASMLRLARVTAGDGARVRVRPWTQTHNREDSANR